VEAYANLRPVRRTGLVLLLAAALLTAACGGSGPRLRDNRGESLLKTATPRPPKVVVIEVFGTRGTRFGGSYGELDDPKAIEGTIPARLTFEMRTGFLVALQKRAQEGQLGIEVAVDGRQVNRATTAKPFGVVTFKQGGQSGAMRAR
jgi:hypothetical protein